MNWTRVEDGLPDFGVPVLLTDGKDVLVGYRNKAEYRAQRGQKPWRWHASGVDGAEWDWDFDEFYSGDPVTHWSPLPELPNTKEVTP